MTISKFEQSLANGAHNQLQNLIVHWKGKTKTWFEKTLTVSYGNPEYGEKLWGWRTEIRIMSNQEFSLTAFNISPEGEDAKATETFYKRIT